MVSRISGLKGSQTVTVRRRRDDPRLRVTVADIDVAAAGSRFTNLQPAAVRSTAVRE